MGTTFSTIIVIIPIIAIITIIVTNTITILHHQHHLPALLRAIALRNAAVVGRLELTPGVLVGGADGKFCKAGGEDEPVTHECRWSGMR